MSLTLNILAEKLKTEGFNEQFYCIGSKWKRLADGHALEAVPNGFEFFYTERGERNLIKFFSDENEACAYVYEFLAKDKRAKSHLIGFFKSKEEADELAEKLRAEEIESKIDKIPYGGINDPRFRVFVFSTDFIKAKELKLAEEKIF